MPIFFQQQINDSTRLGIWKIEESEEFFTGNVPLHRHVTHPHKRLQHLAGRFLLQFLFPGFPYRLIKIADTRKPFLENEAYHFSISHCGDYAAAIVSTSLRVGIDIEIPVAKLQSISHKFLHVNEFAAFDITNQAPDTTSNSAVWKDLTRLWSAKEAVFKWYGDGGVDFSEDIRLYPVPGAASGMGCYFQKTNTHLLVETVHFDSLVLAWVMS